MKNKTLRNDLILIISLLVAITASLLAVLLTRKRNNLIANIYVKDEIVKTVDLTTSKNQKFEVKGTKATVVVEVKDHAIGVVEASCPHQDCVHTGFVSETNRPIICAYNEVYIVIVGDSNYDARINA